MALCLVCGMSLCYSSLECGRENDLDLKRPPSCCRHAAKCGELLSVCTTCLIKDA